MASGVPVVAAQVGGLRDFLHAGKNALLHERCDSASLASALAEALNSRALRRDLATTGLETARAFDERVLLDRYAALIERTTRAA
jgi:D-inositol-3-phosphate glycosyltransferase